MENVILWVVLVVYLFFMPIIFYLTLKCRRNLKHNLQIAAKILNTQPKSSPWSLYKVVEGHYKGRKIIFECNTTLIKAGALVIVKILPHISPKEPKGFMLSYPKPTKRTSFHDKTIYYLYRFLKDNKRDSAGFVGLTRACSEQEIIDVFEELTHAAEVVESNAPYYKK